MKVSCRMKQELNKKWCSKKHTVKLKYIFVIKMCIWFVVPVTSNPCEGSTCQNSATCVADATKNVGYRCDCATGFTGDECESKTK